MVAVAALVLVSCASEEIPTTVYSDAFIISKNISGVQRYGLALHAYSNKSLQAVSVKSPSGTSYSLTQVSSYSNEFYYEDAQADYTVDLPETGTYTFTVTPAADDAVTDGNILAGDAITPVEFTTCEYDSDNTRITLEWELVDDISYSVVRLIDSDGNIVYYSDTLSSTKENANVTTSNWVSGYSPVVGETYTVELHCFLQEDDDTSALESKAITTQEVVWGE